MTIFSSTRSEHTSCRHAGADPVAGVPSRANDGPPALSRLRHAMPVALAPGGTSLALRGMRPSLVRLLVATVLLVASAVPARAGAGDDHPGRATYLRYCGACHGPRAAGDGIAGSFMQPKPTDLTSLAKRNGGTFPFMRTMQYIDGSESVRAHGDPEMPVWGEVFRDQATWDHTRRAEVRGKLMVITDYLQTIQVK